MVKKKIEKPCKDKDHKPSLRFRVPAGKRFVYVCPSCKEETYIIGQ